MRVSRMPDKVPRLFIKPVVHQKLFSAAWLFSKALTAVELACFLAGLAK